MKAILVRTFFCLFPAAAQAFSAMQSVPVASLVLPCHYSLVGRSRAGDGTTFVIPELKWMFDCGALLEGKGSRLPTIVWLTHTHSDHVLTLAQLCYSREGGKKLPIYLPATALHWVRDYLKAYGAMISMGETENDDLLYELIGVTPNQEINIRQSGKQFTVRVVECVHRIDCVGYSIWEQKQKLKEEYRGLSGKDIGSLKKQGIEITTTETCPVLCYLGDTTAAVFTKHPEILVQHPVIVVECSFLDDDSVENARQTQHMHWNDLEPIVKAHRRTLFVLTHFSLKYNLLLLRSFFSQQHGNLHPMLVEADLVQAWQAKQQKEMPSDNKTDPPSCNCFVCKLPNNHPL
jgi:ribonuclease Z